MLQNRKYFAIRFIFADWSRRYDSPGGLFKRNATMRRDANMSLPTLSHKKLSRRTMTTTLVGPLLGILCCTLLAATILVSAPVCHGQEYLDLPDDNGPSLTGRFQSLKDRLSRGPQPSKPSPVTSSRRSNPRPPRYRNHVKSSSRNQRPQRNSSPPASNLPSGISSRSRSNDLLPNTELFSRGSQPLPDAPRSDGKQPAAEPFDAKLLTAKRLKPATSAPRAGSIAPRTGGERSESIERSKPAAATRVARRSPAASRANELDAALADLLNTKPVSKPQTMKQPVKKLASRKSPQGTAAISSGTFDLRKALQDDENDAIAAEAARAVDATTQPNFADPVVETPPIADPIVAKPTTEAVAEEAIKAPAETEKETPQTETKPQFEPEPIVLEPIAEVAAPKQKTTVVKPRIVVPPKAKPSLPEVSESKKSDPFDTSAHQAFNAPKSGNPMRPFTSSPEPVRSPPVIARPERAMLQSTKQAVIVSHVEGPRSILVGHEATYQVTLENTSSTPAANLAAEISVPEWAEMVDAMSTSGVVERSSDGANAGALEWKLSELPPRSSQALRLRLIPRSGRPLQLGVRWSMQPMEAQAIVEVQEPKLEVAISGPQEVHFGKPQRYRLTLSNPGTGMTEQVSLRLVPPGGDPQSATTQQVGNLKPGEVKDLDLELTAREAGELLIQANASADGGLEAETTKTVLCLKPELSVDWRGPDKKYAGTVAAYYFRVQNPGTAATEPVEMNVKMPAGAEFVSASEGYSINALSGVVTWRLASIKVSEEQFMQLRCKIAKPGKNEFEVVAKTSDGDLSDNKAFHTDVVALADLQLDVRDPQGPLPLGEAVVYEISVRNRGTTSAENINVVGLFSEGIDPTTVEGAQYTVRDGRVSFHPIKSLPAGREIQLRIHAKASQVGTHIFRTEVTCPKLDIKLAEEETTRFYEDQQLWEEGQTPYMAERETSEQR